MPSAYQAILLECMFVLENGKNDTIVIKKPTILYYI